MEEEDEERGMTEGNWEGKPCGEETGRKGQGEGVGGKEMKRRGGEPGKGEGQAKDMGRTGVEKRLRRKDREGMGTRGRRGKMGDGARRRG